MLCNDTKTIILQQFEIRLLNFVQGSENTKSQIAHSDMRHPVSGINSLTLTHSVSLASHVSTNLLVHLSAHLRHHSHSHHPSLLHSFTPGSKPTFSTNPSHLNFSLLLYSLDCLHDNGTGLDLSCS